MRSEGYKSADLRSVAVVVQNAVRESRVNGDASVAELVKRVSTDVSTLVRDEMALAKIELANKGKQAGLGAGLLGSGGVMAWFGLGALVAAAILGISEGLPGWAAALIVAGGLFVIAALMALLGRGRLQRA